MTEQTEIARASDLGLAIRGGKDIAGVIGASLRHDGLVVTESELSAEFFDLRSGLAGEAFQKFANYRAKIAIVVTQRDRYGARFSELMYEHRSHALVRFFATESEAIGWLQSSKSQAAN